MSDLIGPIGLRTIPWTDMPYDGWCRLMTAISHFDEPDSAALSESWDRLRQALEFRRQGVPDLQSPSRTEEDNRELLYQYLCRFEKQHPGLPESDLNLELSRVVLLMKAIDCGPIKALTLRRYPELRQSFPEPSAEEIDLARNLHQQIRTLCASIHRKKAPPWASPTERAGAFCLTLILECGVLNLEELRGALQVAWDEPIRATRETYYLWLKLGEVHGVVQEHRRPQLTSLATALAMGLGGNKSDEMPTIKEAMTAIGRRLGYRQKQRLHVTQVMRGAAVILRLRDHVQQFVVDYAERRFMSHALTETAWRRLLNLAPWPDEPLPESRTSRARPAEQDPDDTVSAEIPYSNPALDRWDPLAAVGKIFAKARSTSECLEEILVIRECYSMERSPRPAFGNLLDWLVHLHMVPGSNGQIRRPNSIRNLFMALAPRLLAAAGRRELPELEEDDWIALSQSLTDEQLSPSWRSTIMYALGNFQRWAVEHGVLPQTQVEVSYAKAGSAVNANIVSPRELEQIRTDIKASALSGSASEREFQNAYLAFGYRIALRKKEFIGIADRELHLGPNPSLDIVNNEFRDLKTVASSRRVPLSLIPERFVQSKVEPLKERMGGTRMLADAFGLQVDPETTLRKLSKTLHSVTQDDQVHLHALRHSAATLTTAALLCESLQLDRFTDRFPFIKDVMELSQRVRPALMEGKSSLHTLHAVRQLLGHRHESMTLLHYIHCLDLLRYAAVTLHLEEPTAAMLLGADGVGYFQRSTRSKIKMLTDTGAVLRLLESRHEGRVRRHDIERAPSPDQELSRNLLKEGRFRYWINASRMQAKASVHSEAPHRIEANSAVAIINERSALGSNRTIKSIDEIRPTSQVELRLGMAMANALSQEELQRFDHAEMAGQLLLATYKRGVGRFVLERSTVRPMYEWLNLIGVRSDFAVTCGVEINRKDKDGKRLRLIEPIDINQLDNLRTSRVLLQPKWNRSRKRKSFPHRAFVWSLAMMIEKK